MEEGGKEETQGRRDWNGRNEVVKERIGSKRESKEIGRGIRKERNGKGEGRIEQVKGEE